MAFIALCKAYVTFASGKNLLTYSFATNNYAAIWADETSIPASNNTPNAKSVDPTTKDYFICGEFSPCEKYFAGVTDSKHLYVWEISEDGHWKNCNIRNVVRKCTKLCFTSNSEYILIADRSGDVYQYSTTSSDSQGKLLLGHISMLLDITLAPDNKYVITCDRDEKIRVSRYPNAYNIEAYCLGHKQFVSSICTLQNTSSERMLLSGSGDGRIILWNYEKGKLLCDRDVSTDVPTSDLAKMAAATEDCDKCSLNSDDSLTEINIKCPAVRLVIFTQKFNVAAVLFYRRNEIAFYDISSPDNKVSFNFLHLLKCIAEPWSIRFDVNGILWVLLPKEGNTLCIYEPQVSNKKVCYVLVDEANNQKLFSVCQYVNNKWDMFKESLAIRDDLEVLFKHHYDNVESYLEKKNERLKEKEQRKKKPKCK